jgi:CheY-like chemotaxis protein
LINLILNSRDAMPDGGVITVTGSNQTIEGENELDLPRGDYVVLAVRDTGCGIAPEMIEQVMEPFFTTKDVGKGTGLGLSMVYGFARQSGGSLRIDSRLGEGTSVEIWLPRAREHAPAVVRKVNGAAEQHVQARLRILLADDHAAVRTTTAAMLQDLGHEVREVGDGPGLISLLEGPRQDYDLVISDYAMPLVSGADVIDRARSLWPDLPCILITGYAETQSIARRPEDVPVLVKPFTPEQMSEAIRTATRQAIAAE